MEFARERELCRIVIVNKLDSRDAHCSDVLQQLREACGRECLPLNLPAGGGDAVVDCFFQPHGRAADFSSVEAAHTQIIDQVVELDEKLMALYLEQGEELSPEQLHDPFEQALREGHLVPVCFASAESGAGIPELLQVVERLMPNPAEGNPPLEHLQQDRKSTRLNSSHLVISYAVFCLKKKKNKTPRERSECLCRSRRSP